ncbi:MAG TPA: DUF885 domain-containing protein [Bryobacteraceae bacterium]|nr:DUF885 domain-containing protein [Bryobacteraceae bacterium]
MLRNLLLLALIPVAFAQRNDALHRIFHDFFEDQMRNFPEAATFRGRTEYDDRWTDWSRQAIEQRTRKRQEFVERLKPFLKTKLSEQDDLSTRLLLYTLERESDTAVLDTYLLRVTQILGFHSRVFLTVDAMPRSTVRDYENIIKRLNAVPALVDQNIATFTEAIARGLVQPPVVVERIVAQLRAQAVAEPERSELLTPFRQMPAALPESERNRVKADAAKAYSDSFLPAWRRLLGFFEGTYAPRARGAIALTSVSEGQKLYAAQVRSMTTTNLSPEQIHEIGKQEVERIEKEMLAIARSQSFTGSLHEFEKKIASMPEQRFRSKEEMLIYCRNAAKVIEPELPRLFRRIPRLIYGIRAIPEAVEASTASNAQPPSPDGSRPGWFNLNTFEPEKQLKYDKEALVLHEAAPGHVFQLSVALELGDLPEFRKGGGRLSAYTEGWALYVELLGSELGVYRDPLSRFGALDSERFRAVRLVVDTGMHALAWSRAQAIDYFSTHAPTESVAEIDRYISWPAQALSYKMGQIKIRELRNRAEKELGPRFDIRDFHDVVLRNGALPMEMLEEVVAAYIRQTLAASPLKAGR